MNEANLTRFGPETYRLVRDKPTTYTNTFVAMEGPGQLVLQNNGVPRAWINVNGRDVLESARVARSSCPWISKGATRSKLQSPAFRTAS